MTPLIGGASLPRFLDHMLQNAVLSTSMTQITGRPREFDESAVLDRAVDLFWRTGYRQTTTRELEATLGISQSSIYNAFGSKQGLMEAALDRYESMTSRALLEPLEQADHGLDAISRFFDSLARWVSEDGKGGCMIINLMAEDGGGDPRIRERTLSYRGRVRGALREALDRAIAAGKAQPGHVDVRADLLFGEVLGINVVARGGASSGEVDRLVAGARHLIDSWRM